MRTFRFLAPLVLYCSAGVLAHADSFNAVASFCPTQPCNNFTYGTVVGGSFSQFNVYTPNFISGAVVPGVNSYYGAGMPSMGIPALPTVANYNGATGSYSTYFTVNQPTTLLNLHPGPYNNPAVVRFTAPHAGTYNVSGIFQGLDFAQGTSTDVHAGSFFSGEITGYGYAGASQTPFGPSNTLTFSGLQTLAAGQTLDFAVGFGTDGNYYYDSTGFDVTISAVPEPSAIILMGTMLLLVVFQARRRFVR